MVLLHAWAGAGKTSTALEFARWYVMTSAVKDVLFTSFTRLLPLGRLLDQVGDRFGEALAADGAQWAALDDRSRRDWALKILAQVRVLWVWDNVEPVTGFPAGSASAWTAAEQEELAGFLHELAQYTCCRVLLTSRRDEQAWLGNLPWRIDLPPMPMLERLELAQAVAARQVGADQRFLEVADWRPLLEFTGGNPLTVIILIQQALRDHRTSSEEIEAFVARLRAGAARITDDATQGRDGSLAASLDYGFSEAFTQAERAALALLSLFQGFVNVEALIIMGDPEIADEPVPAVANLDRATGAALLERASEVGLLTAHGDGYYAVHPAVPWHLHDLFEQHYGPTDSSQGMAVVRGWTDAISYLGDSYHDRHEDDDPEVIGVLKLEEANLLQARQLARDHDWWDLVIGPMQGLRALYDATGRVIEWQRLVAELVPNLADPATGGPLAGYEQEWSILTGYRVRIAQQARDWPAAEKLQQTAIAWSREQAAAALTTAPSELDDLQRNEIRNLEVDLEEIGHIRMDQELPTCVEPYLEAIELCKRMGDQRGEASIAFQLGHAYMDVSDLHNLDEAERWYQRSLELLGDSSTLFGAQVTAQLGSVIYGRFLEARDAGVAAGQLARHLKDAATSYLSALRLLPADDVGDLAAVHHQLGVIFDDASDLVVGHPQLSVIFGDADDVPLPARTLVHYRKAIYYMELGDNHYGAGKTRFNVALTLAAAGQSDDARLYARAALRDYETVGPGAATQADKARQLIADLEQERPDAYDGNPGQAN